MSLEEIYEAVVSQQLFEFKARSPRGVLRTQLRRHCEGILQATRARQVFLQITPDGRYLIKK